MMDYNLSIHTNPDARAWAAFFKKTCDDLGKECDEEWMIGWFANAMMAMHDFQHIQRQLSLGAPQQNCMDKYLLDKKL